MDLDGSCVLIVGGSGLLGSKLLSEGREGSELFYTYHKPVPEPGQNSNMLDITRRDAVFDVVARVSPDVIIHAAALTGVDYCETHKDEAWKVNVEGTRNIAEAAKAGNSTLVYVSTDYVFDGMRGMYRETDEANPLGVYGKTKLEGERIVTDICENYLIARTSVLYGWHEKPNFLTWIVGELERGARINILKDQFNSPTLADDLARMIYRLLEAGECGVFHTAGGERISRLDFARKVAETFGLDESLITPVSSERLNWVAARPKDSSLDVGKVSRIKKPMNVNESLKLMGERR